MGFVKNVRQCGVRWIFVLVWSVKNFLKCDRTWLAKKCANRKMSLLEYGNCTWCVSSYPCHNGNYKFMVYGRCCKFMKCANGKFKKVSENLGSTKYHRGIFGAMIFHCFHVCMRLECVLDVGIRMFYNR